eukprot:9651713-Alexandrium_andersonii.AAC.1
MLADVLAITDYPIKQVPPGQPARHGCSKGPGMQPLCDKLGISRNSGGATQGREPTGQVTNRSGRAL